MGKLATPEWITEGYDSKADWEKAQGKKPSSGKSGKTFKIRKCPKCRSSNVVVVLTGEEGRGSQGWECKKCKWTGKNIETEEVSEQEFIELNLGEEKQ